METIKIVDDQGIPILFRVKKFVAITKSDTVTFAAGVLFVGTGGDLYVKGSDNDSFVLLKNIANGTFIAGNIIAVGASSTAADFVMCY